MYTVPTGKHLLETKKKQNRKRDPSRGDWYLPLDREREVLRRDHRVKGEAHLCVAGDEDDDYVGICENDSRLPILCVSGTLSNSLERNDNRLLSLRRQNDWLPQHHCTSSWFPGLFGDDLVPIGSGRGLVGLGDTRLSSSSSSTPRRSTPGRLACITSPSLPRVLSPNLDLSVDAANGAARLWRVLDVSSQMSRIPLKGVLEGSACRGEMRELVKGEMLCVDNIGEELEVGGLDIERLATAEP